MCYLGMSVGVEVIMLLMSFLSTCREVKCSSKDAAPVAAPMAKPALRQFEATSPEADDNEKTTPKAPKYLLEKVEHDGIIS